MKILPVCFLAFLGSMLRCSPEEVAAPAPLLPVPNASQLAWHRMEMNAFVHFSINTFTNKEWGYGDESPSLFNPTSFDARQWVQLFKETGFKGVILTCKHHDGFCLWPSALTEHSVKSSPWKNGKGDVVGELAKATRDAGLRFGIYVSPWDRNHQMYGKPAYLAYYRGQLHELFSAYGPLFEMWFDGANGGDGYYGGARETRKIDGSSYYQWPGTLELVKKESPEIIFFSDAGPGVRWVGNEKGQAGTTNWNMITPDTLYAGKANIESLLNTGSETGTSWIPAETDVSIRPGWFYHADEDSSVKSPEDLLEIYLTSVGRGSTLLLNVPPDQRGLIHENDAASLKGFHKLLQQEFGANLVLSGSAAASSVRGKAAQFAAKNLVDQNQETYWATDDGVSQASITLSWDAPKQVKYISLQEYIALGQRVKSFEIFAEVNGAWTSVGKGTTIGYKRILKIQPVTASRLRIDITEARGCLTIAEIGVY